jgi:hypothetical protein
MTSHRDLIPDSSKVISLICHVRVTILAYPAFYSVGAGLGRSVTLTYMQC